MKLEQWYALHTKPNAEYRVAAVLQKRGFYTYLPEIESVKVHQGRTKKPCFPCYLFVKTGFEALGLLQMEWTPGLRRVVAFDSRPVPLADEVIELIQHKLGENVSKGRPVHNFKPGETVRIKTGPLQDMLAIFEGPTTPGMRVRVLLNILGQASRVQISTPDIEKVSADAKVPVSKRPRRTRGKGRIIRRISYQLP